MSFGSTKMQMRLLRFIQGYQAATGGVSPSLSEMSNAIGCKGKSPSHRLLLGLEERGKIRRLHNRARAIEVLQPVAIPRDPDGRPLYFVEVMQP